MLTFVDSHHYIQINSEGELESVDEAKITDHSSRMISITEKFYIRPISSNEGTNQTLIPLYPNEQLRRHPISNLNYEVEFTTDRSYSQNKIQHIAEFAQQIAKAEACREASCTFVLIIQNKAVVISKRLEEYLYFACLHFTNPTELIYHLQSIYLSKNLDRETDRLIFKGEIREESQIIHLAKIYFRNISVQGNFSDFLSFGWPIN
ncbi:MAG: DUF3822 family protein [Saprospiraceae bacterium]|nr:DUF3822 family protein [Saprospiraceae bacterium]